MRYIGTLYFLNFFYKLKYYKKLNLLKLKKNYQLCKAAGKYDPQLGEKSSNENMPRNDNDDGISNTIKTAIIIIFHLLENVKENMNMVKKNGRYMKTQMKLLEMKCI